jgi:ubiquinone/menaquinone biosynthesis C-methylase UbiE
MNKRNILAWQEVVKNLSPSYKTWFEDEKRFLIKNIRKNTKILEVGCGNGRSLKDISKVTKNLTGIDHDKTAVQNAKINLKEIKNSKILLADAKKIPFKDKTFDAVLCMGNTFANFYNDKYIILSEMKRVVKDTGSIFISVYSEDALKERLKAYKQANLNIKTILSNGTVIFEDIKVDGYSEQFSKNELESIFKKANLKILEIHKTSIAYLCKLGKIN